MKTRLLSVPDCSNAIGKIRPYLNYGNLCGLLAVLFWGSTLAPLRMSAEAFGPMTSSAMCYGIGGLLGIAIHQGRLQWRRRRERMGVDYAELNVQEPEPEPRVMTHPGGERWTWRGVDWRYMLCCGGLFVTNAMSIGLAIGMSTNRSMSLAVSLINYMWTGLMFVLSIFILGFKTRGYVVLPIGVLAALCGVFLAGAGADFSPHEFAQNFLSNPVPYLLGAYSALTWPLYSNMCRKWSESSRAWMVPVFLVATGVVLLCVAAGFGDLYHEKNITAAGVVSMFYVSLVPNGLAYIFWEVAMRSGDIGVVSALSYFTPLLSTGSACIVLGVPFTLNLGIATILIIGGSVMCKLGLVETKADVPEEPAMIKVSIHNLGDLPREPTGDELEGDFVAAESSHRAVVFERRSVDATSDTSAPERL